MTKTSEELNSIKTEAEELSKKLEELTEEELNAVAAGDGSFLDILKKIGEGIENKVKPVVR